MSRVAYVAVPGAPSLRDLWLVALPGAACGARGAVWGDGGDAGRRGGLVLSFHPRWDAKRGLKMIQLDGLHKLVVKRSTMLEEISCCAWVVGHGSAHSSTPPLDVSTSISVYCAFPNETRSHGTIHEFTVEKPFTLSDTIDIMFPTHDQ